MSREPLTRERARQVVEVALFASDQPLAVARMTQLLGKEYDSKAVREMIDMLNAEYSAQGHCFEIVEIGGGFQMLSRAEYKSYVSDLYRHRKVEKLSPSATETLAIVAYKQPVGRAIVDDIRGVQSGPLLRSLLERGLIKVVGRQNIPGRPILYGTTRLFLEHFGLKSLKELPRVAELTPP